MLDQARKSQAQDDGILGACRRQWDGRVVATLDDDAPICRIQCPRDDLLDVCQWLSRDLGLAFATLIVDERDDGWSLLYVFHGDAGAPWVFVHLSLESGAMSAPSISGLVHGPSADWHERESEDLFGLTFEGHPRLGEFVLHEDWPDGVNPMRRSFDSRQRLEFREPDANWEPLTIVTAPGAFVMPIGPVFSDFAESAHFLLETVGEDVIRTIPRFFYKYRGVEKIAEEQKPDRALLLAERFSGTAAFAHALAFCQALESICDTEIPARALALRSVFAELERLRHHAATITGICNSTALALATSQAALIEEDLLRLSCVVAGHRYLFGLATPGGLARDIPDDMRVRITTTVDHVSEQLHALHVMLSYSNSFLDRLEEVGVVPHDSAVAYGLVGPIARASGLARDMRKLFPYAAYASADFTVPIEQEGDGYARLRVFLAEAAQSIAIMRHFLSALPEGPVRATPPSWRAGAALAAVEAPDGAALHWVRLRDDGAIARYRITPASFANWHGFRLAAEDFAFQDFPIILASFGLSNAECDR